MMFSNVAVLGAGTIGMSWAVLFAASGRKVAVFDPAPDLRARGLAAVQEASKTLRTLGWEHAGNAANIRFTDDPAEAVQGADFIQENAPENLDVKHELYAKIEPHLICEAIIGSSTSGLTLTEMQQGFSNPGRIVLAHPFNPPHLVPLVELMENTNTDPGVLDIAQSFYETLGKDCVRLKKEIPGHIANRLQAAIWRETIHLAIEGVASIQDIDKAVVSGPGLRWAVLGPNTLFHLGGGAGGIRHFCEHLGAPFQYWWNDLGEPDLTSDVLLELEEGLLQASKGTTLESLSRYRDAAILKVLTGLGQLEEELGV
ncbi:MAG: NAD-binding protein [Rhodobacteraceae bacterium]|nr:NAD-binding protein [Paracoccaceae bacterium]